MADPLGYSGTPLAKKLGIRSGQLIRLYHPPEDYLDFFRDLPEDFNPLKGGDSNIDFVHYFATEAEKLNEDLPKLKNEIAEKGMIWISWPKKSSRVETDVDSNVVRSLGLRHGLVDIKVCSVNETWSALKFVIPVKDRTS